MKLEATTRWTHLAPQLTVCLNLGMSGSASVNGRNCVCLDHRMDPVVEWTRCPEIQAPIQFHIDLVVSQLARRVRNSLWKYLDSSLMRLEIGPWMQVALFLLISAIYVLYYHHGLKQGTNRSYRKAQNRPLLVSGFDIHLFLVSGFDIHPLL